MKYSLYIARQYLLTKRKTGFISVIAYISIAGVALGTTALIVTLCIISGFEREMKNKFISFDSHIRVRKFENTGWVTDSQRLLQCFADHDEIKGISPYIEKEAMIRSKQKTDGVMVKGIDQEKVDQVLDIRKDVLISRSSLKIDLRVSDSVSLGANHDRQKIKPLPGILIGKKLADKLYLQVGDKVTLFSLRNTLSFIQQPKVRQFTVTGIYRSGLSEYDNVLVYIDIQEAQEFFETGGGITGYELRAADLVTARETASKMAKELGYPYYVRSWFDLHRNLFGWLETNNFIMTIIFSLIILVAAFNMIATLFMIVMEKTKDIGILKSMGASRWTIRNIFMAEGLLIGLSGSVIGMVLSAILCFVQSEYRLLALKSEVYFMDAVPVQMAPSHFLSVSLFAIGLCLLAAVFPAVKASKLNPVDAIRYE